MISGRRFRQTADNPWSTGMPIFAQPLGVARGEDRDASPDSHMNPLQYELSAPDTVGARSIDVSVLPALTRRNRLTSAFRVILAIPHLILVGGPAALAISLLWSPDGEAGMDWASGGGVLGVTVMVAATVAWFSIVFTGRMPQGIWNLSAYYLRWRVRAAVYVALLRDEYPPFGEGPYMAELTLPLPGVPRDRVSVAFRILLALPHVFAIWILGIAWMLTSVCAWFVILLTGNYPKGLYEFAVGVLRWSTNVEAYLLLLHDEFPPFSLSS